MGNKLEQLKRDYDYAYKKCARIKEEIKKEEEICCNHEWFCIGSVHNHLGDTFCHCRCEICGIMRFIEEERV